MPQGADIEVNGINRGTTPASVKLKKGFDGQTVTLKKDGISQRFFNQKLHLILLRL